MYYCTSSETRSVSRKIHWCFIGEVVAIMSVEEPAILVRDREGHVVPISFDRSQPFSDANLVLGNTLCVMYAHRNTKQDNKSAQRNSWLSSFTDCFAVLPCSLQTLLSMGDFIATQAHNCMMCGIPARHSCVRCNIHYCSRVPPLVKVHVLMSLGMSEEGLAKWGSQSSMFNCCDCSTMVYNQLERFSRIASLINFSENEVRSRNN